MAHTFFFDGQSNIRTLQKEKNCKRKDISFLFFLDLMVKYYKLNNDKYKEMCYYILEEYDGNN